MNLFTYKIPSWHLKDFLTLPSIFVGYFEKYLNMSYFFYKNSNSIIYDDTCREITEFPEDFFRKRNRVMEYLDTLPKNELVAKRINLNQIIEKNYYDKEISSKNKMVSSRKLFYKTAYGNCPSYSLFEPIDDNNEIGQLFSKYERLLGPDRSPNIVDDFIFCKLDKVNTREYYIEQDIIDALYKHSCEDIYLELMREIDQEKENESSKKTKKKKNKKKKNKSKKNEPEEKKNDTNTNKIEQCDEEKEVIHIITVEKKEKNFNSDSNDSTTKNSSSESCEKNNNNNLNFNDSLKEKTLVNSDVNNNTVNIPPENKNKKGKDNNETEMESKLKNDLSFTCSNQEEKENIIKEDNLINNINTLSRENEEENHKEEQDKNKIENEFPIKEETVKLTEKEIEEFGKEINKARNNNNININQIKHPRTSKEILHNLIVKESNKLLQNANKLNSSHYKSLMFLFTKIKEFLNPNEFKIEIYGSYSTGLQLESSDIDISVQLSNIEDYSVGILITELSNHLEKYIQFENLFPIVQTAVPILKFYINPNKITDNFEEKKENITEEESKIQIDLTFNLTKIKENISFTNELMKQNKEIKPLFLLLKNMLKINKLNSTFDGGISSHCLFLMISAYLKSIKNSFQKEKNNLGQLLLEFLYFYGKFFNFSNTIIDLTSPK